MRVDAFAFHFVLPRLTVNEKTRLFTFQYRATYCEHKFYLYHKTFST